MEHCYIIKPWRNHSVNSIFNLLLQSPEKMAQHYFGDADYKIYIKSDKEPTELLYSGNPLNDNLKEEIGSIPGINEMQTLRKSATFTFEYKGYGGRGMCDMITNAK